jgi:hypothetical protein
MEEADRSRELVLGREAIVDRRDDAPRTGTQIAAHPVMGIKAAQHDPLP